ncbi:MAG: hypothetical protein F4217_08100 [Acidimicrobiaceae bacterium]|nr:hypothetical protein [Acidimicrobiaceae bacterium]
MRTITPPETREDEFQVDDVSVDESADKNILLRMSPSRVKAKSKERNCMGFNYIQLIVGMVIFVALSRIVGPPAFRMINRARATALHANIQTAAQTVRDVLAIEPGKKGAPDATNGNADSTFLAAVTDDAPFNWIGDSWELEAGDDSDTIRVQFIGDTDGTNGSYLGTALAEGSDAAAPAVDWLLNDWDAVRIQAKNEDGGWACALIVLRPNTEDDDQTGAGVTPAEAVSTEDPLVVPTGFTGTAIAKQLADARLRGVWFDSGDSGYATNTHCSPAGDPDAAGGGLPVYDPFPESADEWTIPLDGDDRVLTRNI